METNIYKKLLLIQNELKAPKGQKNTFGNYKYRSCEDILESVKPLLLKNNTTLHISDELVLIGDRYYIKATATLIDIDSQLYVENIAYAREEETKKGMDGSQITGAASSYARKYALNGLFCIDDTKDADTDEYQKQVKQEVKIITGDDPDKEASPEKGYIKKDSYAKEILATEKQKEMIKSILTDEELEKTKEKYGNDLEKLDIQMASKIISSKKGNN